MRAGKSSQGASHKPNFHLTFQLCHAKPKLEFAPVLFEMCTNPNTPLLQQEQYGTTSSFALTLPYKPTGARLHIYAVVRVAPEVSWPLLLTLSGRSLVSLRRERQLACPAHPRNLPGSSLAH